MTNLSNQLPSDDNFSIRADWPQRRGALAEHRDAFADRCTGNALEEYKIYQEFGLTTMELLDLLLDVNVERCRHCRWLLPLWLTFPLYFVLGAAWALTYLPRSIAQQALKYKRWRDALTNGLPLEQVLYIPGNSDNSRRKVNPLDFLRIRTDSRIGSKPMRSILIRFILNVAFWPLSILDKALRSAWPMLCRFTRWVFRVLSNILTFVGELFSFIDRCLQKAWDFVYKYLAAIGRWLRDIWQWMGRVLRSIWTKLFAPLFRWIFARVQFVYKTIIQFANREAIADLAAINKPTAKANPND